MSLSVALAALGVLAVALLILLLRLRRQRHTASRQAVCLDDLTSARPRRAPTEAGTPAPPAASPPPTDVAEVHQVACWTGLARDLAAQGRLERATVAQWAADLHVLAPHLQGRRAELVEHLSRLPADTPLSTLSRAREIALSLVADTTGSVTAMLVPADHMTATSGVGAAGSGAGLRRTAVPGDRAACLALAEHWASRAATAAALGELGLEAREAELARFDALLVGLGAEHGDEGDHVTSLLGELARAVVRALAPPEPTSPSTQDARLVHQTLRQLLPPHVRGPYDDLQPGSADACVAAGR